MLEHEKSSLLKKRLRDYIRVNIKSFGYNGWKALACWQKILDECLVSLVIKSGI